MFKITPFRNLLICATIATLATVYRCSTIEKEIPASQIQEVIQTKHKGLERTMDFDYNMNKTLDRVHFCKDGSVFFQDNYQLGKRGFVKAK